MLAALHSAIPHMKTRSLDRHRAHVTFLTIVLCFGFAALAVAAPSDEIARALAANGASDVKHATAEQFDKAFTTVLVRAKHKDMAAYVSEAVKMRPDLADRIVVAAIRVGQPSDGKVVLDKQLDCEWVEPIIRAAITAAPDARDAIVRAALAADPWARECILAAAGTPGAETAFNINSTFIGTINPANIGGQGVITSEEQPPEP